VVVVDVVDDVDGVDVVGGVGTEGTVTTLTWNVVFGGDETSKKNNTNKLSLENE
jgi:hypothetical protein